jgi:CHAT domain-containing protein/tetratricopeptide (TPR) repeat protein
MGPFNMSRRRRSPVVCALTLFVVLAAGAATNGQRAELAPGVPIERSIAAGDAHVYSISLTAGDFVHVRIDQRAIDLRAALVGPDDRRRLVIDASTEDFMPEHVVDIADRSGPFYLTISPAAGAATGRYVIRLEAVRRPTPQDEMRLEAERLFAAARSKRAGTGSERGQAVDELRRGAALFRDLGDGHGELKALVYTAQLEYSLARQSLYDTAQDALALARKVDDPSWIAIALASMNYALQRRGDLAGALRLVEEALPLYAQVGHRRLEAASHVERGGLLARLGDGERGIQSMQRGLAIERARRDLPALQGTLNNLGIAYKNLGDLEKSLASYEEALPLFRESGDDRAEALVLNNMGNVLRLLDEPGRALEAHLRALELSRKMGAVEDEARSLNTIGLTHYALGQFERALEHHRQSLGMRIQLKDLPGMASSHLGEGRALHRLGRHDDASTAVREALRVWRDIRDPYGEPDALRALAEVERARGNAVDALAYARDALDLNEALRRRITSPELRASYQGTVENGYELLIDLLMERHHAEPAGGHAAAAFHVSERARARVLLESLLEARVDLREGADPGLLARERVLQRQLRDASALLSRILATGSGNRPAAAAEVDRLTNAYQELEAEIRLQSPRYASVTLPQPMTVPDIQRVLDADTVLLEFALGAERSWLWAVTSDDVTTVELAAKRDVESAARGLYEHATARQPRSGEPYDAYIKRVAASERSLAQASTTAGRVLLGGIAEQLNGVWRGKRLLFVTTGALESVPFGALFLPAPGSQSGTGPLIMRHEIVTAPSASVLATLRAERTSREASNGLIAILADPVFEPGDPRVQGRQIARAMPATRTLEEAPEPVLPVTRVVERMSDGSSRAGVTRLPFSRHEADAIVALAGRARVVTAMDFQANRSTAIGDAVTRSRIVHFATHGWLDPRHPDLTGLVLSLVDERGRPQDGFLRLQDIYNMRIRADLVVLSACQTAQGKAVTGEGLMSLTRAFMYAGAPGVVASLWQVSDAATAELMKHFYAGMLQRKLTPAAALRAAQIAMSRDRRWTSPYFWAGFTLHGDWK